MFEPCGPFQAALGAKDLTPWRHAVAEADQFSLSLSGLRVTTEPGRHVRRKVADALRQLHGAVDLVLFSARRWLGTATTARLVVLGSTRSEFASRWRTSGGLFDAVGDDGHSAQLWEDVALYRGGRVSLWTCTHEQEGTVYGSEGELRNWQLQIRTALVPRIDAEELGSAAQKDILEEAGVLR